MKNMSLPAFEKSLKQAKTLKQANHILENYLTNLGINTFAFTYYAYSPSSLNKLKYDFSSPNFTLWHKHYISEGYEDVDTTLDVVYQTTLPAFWDLQTQLSKAKNPRERKMRQDSIAFGAEKGVSIPIHGPQEDFAILLLVQMRGQKCLDHFDDQQYEIFAAAYYFYHYVQQLLLQAQPSVAKYQLKPREMQCLTLIAKHFSNAAIAKSLGITERTVNFHIQRLNKKLGTQNKYQSVIKALQKGIIKI